jgi:hypothetical protein
VEKTPLKSRPGFSTLGTVFTLVLVLVVLGFSLSAASVSHLHLNTHNLRETEARQLARSAAADAIAQFFEAPEYGADRSAGDNVSIALAGTHPDAQGVLTFHPDTATDLGIRYSTNNLGSTASVTGDGRIVPGRAVHLVAEGTSGNVTRRVEAMLRFTLFPQAIASSGPVVSTGPLLVATLANPDIVSEDGLLPADLLSNAPDEPSVTLADGTKVTGDVQTVGTVELPTTFEVWGEVRPEADPEDIVTLEPEDYDPVELGLTPEGLDDPSYPGPFLIEGAARATGSVIIDGDLVFDGGLLYTEGDLHVTGKITGTGILASQGKIQVDQGADFQAGQKVAIISEGKVDLRGTGPQTNFFQGLIYTKGGLSAEQITVIGAVINDATESDAVALNGSRVFYDPSFPEIVIETETLPEVLNVLDVTDGLSYVVTVNPATNPPQLEYFEYTGEVFFGNMDPDEARVSYAQQVQGQTPDSTFEIDQSLLDLTDSDYDGDPGDGGGGFMGPGDAITPGRGIVVEVTDALDGLTEFHEALIAPVADQLNDNHAEVMTGSVIRGFDRRDTSWMDGTGEEERVALAPSEALKPNEHNRLVMWLED